MSHSTARRDSPWVPVLATHARRLVLLTAVEAVLFAPLLWGVTARSPRYLLYPFVWVNVGVLALWAAPVPGDRRSRAVAALVGVAYLGLLTWVDGTVAYVGGAGSLSASVAWLPPGWGPLTVVTADPLRLRLVPFRVFGDLALAALVGLAVADARGLLGALLGPFSCVSCTLPVAAAVVGGGLGGALGVGGALVMADGTAAAGVAWATGPLAVDLATVAYLAAVGLLWAGRVRSGA